MDLAKAELAQLMIPVDELWLAEFTDPDGNQLALLSEVATSSA